VRSSRFAVGAVLFAATSASPPGPDAAAKPIAPRRLNAARETTIRVLVAVGFSAVRVGSTRAVVFLEGDGEHLIARSGTGAAWRIERDGRRVRAVRPDGVPTVWVEGPIIARSEGTGEPATPLVLTGKSYRGEFLFYGADSGVMVVNRLPIEEYLRAVVPLEMGTRSSSDVAAVEAQAVTARSYAYIHLSSDPARAFDVTAGVLDQVYGGVAGETEVGNAAVESTRGLVLMYAGRVVNAPYHATCGGTTAAASEIWRSPDEPYLQPVSDRVPGAGRDYCDIAPRYRWTRSFDAATLNAALAQYLATYATVPAGIPGIARDVAVASHTPSGRVGLLRITTDRGNFLLHGNDIRYVLRAGGGEILNSTYFSVETVAASDGTLARLTLHGTGYGHGVGMCQWGAIGRARAGQDFRTILRTYYSGTTVGSAG